MKFTIIAAIMSVCLAFVLNLSQAQGEYFAESQSQQMRAGEINLQLGEEINLNGVQITCGTSKNRGATCNRHGCSSCGTCTIHGCPSCTTGYSGGSCNVHGCWDGSEGACNVHGCSDCGTCNVHGCPTCKTGHSGGTCNMHGCWDSSEGSCNTHGCSDYGKCTRHGCP